MTQDEIIEMARQAGFIDADWNIKIVLPHLEAFANLVAEKEREVVANWIMDRGFATGHGDSIVDLLDQLEWQIAEKEREACAKLVEDSWMAFSRTPNRRLDITPFPELEYVAKVIRARGQA
jgi:hypothetical protein